MHDMINSCSFRLFAQAMRRTGAGASGKDRKAKFELTEEQKQEIREAFDLFDTDGSGKVILFINLGCSPFPLSLSLSLYSWFNVHIDCFCYVSGAQVQLMPKN